MKCDKIRELLSAYLDEELSVKEATSVRRHLEDCIDCQEELLDIDKVRKAIHALPSVKAPAELIGKIRDNIAQFDITEEPITQSVFWRYRVVIRGFVAVAAAVLVVYVGIVLVPNVQENKVLESQNDVADDENNHAILELGKSESKKTLSPAEKEKPGDNENALKEEFDHLSIDSKQADRDMEPGSFYKGVKSREKSKESGFGPVVFSQQVKITSKNAEDAVNSIRKFEAQYSRNQGNIHLAVKAPGSPSIIPPAVTGGAPKPAPGLYAPESTNKVKTDKSKTKQQEERLARKRAEQPAISRGAQKTSKQYRVIIPVAQKEAFIEQLKLQKIGEVKATGFDVVTGRYGSSTANQVLKDEIVNQVNDKLRKEVSELKNTEEKKDSREYEKGYGSGKDADKKSGVPAEGKSKNGVSADEINKSLIVLHDLKQQKEMQKQLACEMESGLDAEDSYSETNDGFAGGLKSKAETLKSINESAGGLAYVELIITIEEE